jgi:hypothetical protein
MFLETAQQSVSCDQQLTTKVASNGIATVTWVAAPGSTTTIPQANVVYDTYKGRVWKCLLPADFAYAPYCAQQLMDAWAYSQWSTASTQTTCGNVRNAATASAVATTISIQAVCKFDAIRFQNRY